MSNQMVKRGLAVLLAVLMLVSLGAAQLAQAGLSVGTVGSLKVASVTTSQVQLKWAKVSKADGYSVFSYNEKKKEWKAEGDTTDAAFTDTNLKPGAKMIYQVKAYRLDGKTRVFGKASSSVTALTKPERAASLTAKLLTTAKVKLTWSAAKGATGYQILAKTKGGAFKKVATSKKRTYTITYKAAPGVVYYKILAFAKVGKITQYADKYSKMAKASTKPAPVKSLTASNIGGATATLKWKASAGASEYIIFKKDVSTNGEFVKAATVKGTTYQVKYPASPRTVHYRVQASATVNGKTILAPVSEAVYISLWPKAVTSLQLKEAKYNALTLAWNKADGASEYHVYQYVAGELKEIATTDKTTYTVSDLEPGESYSFRVRAVAVFAEQVTETEISPVLTAQTKFGKIKGATVVLNTSNTATLSWKALEGAQGYEIEKKDGGWNKIGESKTTSFNVSDKENGKQLATGKTYQYRIRAYLKDGGNTIYSPYTDVIELHSIPERVSEPKAASGSGKVINESDPILGNFRTIVVDWPTVAGADGYQVQWLDHGKWVDQGIKGEPVGELHLYKHNGEERAYYSVNMSEKDTGTQQFRVAAAVKNSGRWTYASYSPSVSINFTYEPERKTKGVDLGTLYPPSLARAGLFGYLYDPNEVIFYTSNDPWQRETGFNKLYDFASPFVWIQYDTTRFCFDHQGLPWMLQPWKGQYGAVLYGAELGVYVKYPPRDPSEPHYDCAKDNDRLLMSMDFERSTYDEDGKMTDQWNHEFYRPYGTYWWCTGFKLGYLRMTPPTSVIGTYFFLNEDANRPEDQSYPDIRANYRVTLQDFEMLDGFTAALKNGGYEQVKYKAGSKPGTLEYAVNGLDVYFPY